MAQENRTFLHIGLCLCAAGCGVPREEQIADRLEAAVESSALPLTSISDYSQYYFEHEDGAVDGVFVMQLPNSHVRREWVQEACDSNPINGFPCDQTDYGLADAGDRKWVPTKLDLPMPSGGGCLVIQIHLSAPPQKLSEPKCNGPH
jgi:hypothetical protein